MSHHRQRGAKRGGNALTRHDRQGESTHGRGQGPGLPVKGESALDSGASSRGTHHGPPGDQAASQVGASAPTPPKAGTGLASVGGLRYCGTHGEQCPDLHRRVVTTRSSKPLGVSAHNRRPRARCGWETLLQSTKNPTAGKAVWWKCEARDCPDCGPAKREANLAHDIANLTKSGRPVVRRVIDAFDDATWKRLRAKIKRAADAEGIKGGWTAYPQDGRMLVVYAVVGMTGALVTDLADELASDYGGIPAGERIRRPRCWSLNPKPAGKGEGGPAYRLLGASTVTHRAPDVLKRLGLYRDQVDEAAVPLEAWEAHNFTLPPLDSYAYRALVDAFDLEKGKAKPSKRPRLKAVGE